MKGSKGKDRQTKRKLYTQKKTKIYTDRDKEKMKREKGNNEIDEQTEARNEKEMEELKISNYILTPTNPTEQKKT